MSVREVTYYQVVCDHPGCTIATGDDGGPHSAWSSRDDAVWDWTCGDHQTVDGRHYCLAHRVPECCECDATDSLVEHDDGDHYCPTHILTVRSTQ